MVTVVKLSHLLKENLNFFNVTPDLPPRVHGGIVTSYLTLRDLGGVLAASLSAVMPACPGLRTERCV